MLHFVCTPHRHICVVCVHLYGLTGVCIYVCLCVEYRAWHRCLRQLLFSLSFSSLPEFAQLLPSKPHDTPFHSWPILVWMMHTVVSFFSIGTWIWTQVFKLPLRYFTDSVNFPGLNFLSFLFLGWQNVSLIELHSPIQAGWSELLIILSFSSYLK